MIEIKEHTLRGFLAIYREGVLWRVVRKSLFISYLRNTPSHLLLEKFPEIERKVARQKALWLLSRKNRFQRELSSKLLEVGISEKVVSETIQWCQERSLFSDEEECKRRQERLQRKGYGPRYICQKLQGEKGGKIAMRMSKEQQVDSIRLFLDKRKSMGGPKIVRALLSRGFEIEAILSVVKI